MFIDDHPSRRHLAVKQAEALYHEAQRLHVVCGRHRDWTLRDALAHLPRLAPSLACLRISNATYTHGSHGCVAAFLRRALDVQEGADLAAGGDAGLQ